MPFVIMVSLSFISKTSLKSYALKSYLEAIIAPKKSKVNNYLLIYDKYLLKFNNCEELMDRLIQDLNKECIRRRMSNLYIFTKQSKKMVKVM